MNDIKNELTDTEVNVFIYDTMKMSIADMVRYIYTKGQINGIESAKLILKEEQK